MLKIMQLRKEKEITQAELADRCETTQQTIAKIENGLVDPRVSTLAKIADALGCEVGELFFSQAEFLQQVNAVIKEFKIDLKKTKLLGLNTVCSKEKYIPSYHPYWEKIVILDGQIKLMEEKR